MMMTFNNKYKLITFNWKNNIFTGLVQNNNKYFIIWGKSTCPIFEIEINESFAAQIITSYNGTITSKIINSPNLYQMMILENKEEYTTAAKLIHILLGDKNGT